MSRRQNKKAMDDKTAIQPQDIAAEAALLGAILLSPQSIAAVDDLVRQYDFFEKKHEHIYQAALEVYREGKEVDILTIGSQLRNNKQFQAIGGNNYLQQLLNTVPSSVHIKSYAEIIIAKARRRNLIEASAALRELAFDEKKNLAQIIEEAEIKLFSVSERQVQQNAISLEIILKECFKRLQHLQENKDELRGLSSGFRNLDNFLAGFQKSDLFILAGRPGMGKTGFALNLAYNIAYHSILEKQKTVLYFSLEMSKDQLVDRLLSMHTGIDNWNLRTGRLKASDFAKVTQALDTLGRADLFIDDTPGLNIAEIRTKSRRANYKQKLDAIVVDYLQLMRGSSPQYGDNRVQEVSEISRGLKLLAKELDIPIIALSQLSRQTESRKNMHPELADLRESGSIEQDADIVAFLYREEYYNPDLEDKKGLLELQIKKHRNGPVGTVLFFFNKEIQRYLEITKETKPVDVAVDETPN